MRTTIILLFAVFIVGGAMYAYLENEPATDAVTSPPTFVPVSDEVVLAERLRLPLGGSAPVDNVYHTIPIGEIRQGCFRQDCIPSIDDPVFVEASELSGVLEVDSLGIKLSYNGESRFYPFPMLETHELVNDTINGEPVLISYCPLCGTGIVYERLVGGVEAEFGVSGMLWQSNLLMYNRAAKLEDRNLWSQVLGEAVVGSRASEKLTIIPSDITTFANWLSSNPGGKTLVSGSPQNPYGGDYLRTAFTFAPDFDPEAAELAPDAYVYGVIIDGQPLAIPASAVSSGETYYEAHGITLMKSDDQSVTIRDAENTIVPDVEGFWFSWQAAHPETKVITTE